MNTAVQAWLGRTRLGWAWRGSQGMAVRDAVRRGVARRVRHVMDGLGPARRGMAGLGRHGNASSGAASLGAAWLVLAWLGRPGTGQATA